jgi:phosphoenolpyruvate---glycerone phosphotransferase subunit DhaL
MRAALTLDDFLPLTTRIAAALDAATDEITALDAAIGDGDLGVTCRLGMQAALGSAAKEAETLADALLKAGMAFNSSAASTYGALVMTAAMKAAKHAKDNGLTQWDLPALSAATEAAIAGITQRGGGAQLGDKTLLDALIPAIVAMKAAQAEGKSLAEGLQAAAIAALAGAEATRPLKAKFGRANWLQDQTIGVQDPGATVVAVVMRALAEYVA